MIGFCLGYLANNTPTQDIRAILAMAENAFKAICAVDETIVTIEQILKASKKKQESNTRRRHVGGTSFLFLLITVGNTALQTIIDSLK